MRTEKWGYFEMFQRLKELFGFGERGILPPPVIDEQIVPQQICLHCKAKKEKIREMKGIIDDLHKENAQLRKTAHPSGSILKTDIKYAFNKYDDPSFKPEQENVFYIENEQIANLVNSSVEHKDRDYVFNACLRIVKNPAIGELMGKHAQTKWQGQVVWKKQCGQYRIIYQVKNGKVNFLEIGNRRDIYGTSRMKRT
jgi:mRNA-degrading endonuclease RelE of RelBE toxin-antitoxin system